MKLITSCSIMLLFLMACTPALAQTPDTTQRQWSLRQCVEYALANNLNVQRGQLNVEDSEIDLNTARLSRLPTTNAGTSYGYSWGRGLDPFSNQYVTQQIRSVNIGANASLPLVNGGRISNTIAQNKHAYAASQRDLEKTQNDVILNVASLFINVVFSKELLENAKFQLASTQQQLERTRKQVAAGALARSEELNLDAQVATNELNLVQQENALALALLQLKQAMQMPASQPLDVEVPTLEPEDLILDQNRDDIYEVARQTMPEVKSAELKIESSYYAVKAARGNLYPRLSVEGGINTLYSSVAEAEFYPDGTTNFEAIGFVDKDVVNPASVVYSVVPNGQLRNTYLFGEQLKDNIYRTLTLQLTIPIFNNNSARASLQRSRIQNERAKVDAKEISNTLRQNVETAYNDAVAASKSYNSATRQVRAREEAFRIMQQRYEIGAINFVEYQVSENDLFRAKSDMLRAKYDFIFKKKVLDFYQGKTITN